jgi:hypothetical protein
LCAFLIGTTCEVNLSISRTRRKSLSIRKENSKISCFPLEVSSPTKKEEQRCYAHLQTAIPENPKKTAAVMRKDQRNRARALSIRNKTCFWNHAPPRGINHPHPRRAAAALVRSSVSRPEVKKRRVFYWPGASARARRGHRWV